MFLRKYLHNAGFKSQLQTFFRWLFIGKIFLLFNHSLKSSTNILWRNLSGVFFYGQQSLASEEQFLSKTIHLPAVTICSPVACIFLSALLSLLRNPVILGWETEEPVPVILTVPSVQVCISRVYHPTNSVLFWCFLLRTDSKWPFCVS